MVPASNATAMIMSIARMMHVHFNHCKILNVKGFSPIENCWRQFIAAEDVTRRSSNQPINGTSGIKSTGIMSYIIDAANIMSDVICLRVIFALFLAKLHSLFKIIRQTIEIL